MMRHKIGPIPPNDSPDANTSMYRVDFAERWNRLTLAILAVVAVLIFFSGLTQIVMALVVGFGATALSFLWPTDSYEVSRTRLIHRRAFGSQTVRLDQLSRGQLDWTPYSEGRLVFSDATHARVELRISEATRTLRLRIGAILIDTYTPSELRPMLSNAACKALGIEP